MTQIALGEDFAIALGLTLPQQEYAKLAAQNGVLKQSSYNDGKSRPNIRRIKNGGSVKEKTQTYTNYQEAINNSHAKPGRDRCNLRQKSPAAQT